MQIIRCKIIIANLETLLAQGLKAMLFNENGFDVIAINVDLNELIGTIESMSPDVVLIDPYNFDKKAWNILHICKKKINNLKIIVLTTRKDGMFVDLCLQLGVNGYILKNANKAELLFALESVLLGKHFLSPNIMDFVIKGYLKNKENSLSLRDKITKREIEIMKLIAEGYTSREIANLLRIDSGTVLRHRSNLMKKLDLHNTSEITRCAVKNRLIEITH